MDGRERERLERLYVHAVRLYVLYVQLLLLLSHRGRCTYDPRLKTSIFEVVSPGCTCMRTDFEDTGSRVCDVCGQRRLFASRWVMRTNESGPEVEIRVCPACRPHTTVADLYDIHFQKEYEIEKAGADESP